MTNGENIRRLREAADIQQYQLAARLGIPQSTLSDWERGKRQLSELDLRRARAAIKAMTAERDLAIAELLGEE